MNEFRYVIRKSRATDKQVREYATKHDIPMMLAKKELEEVTAPILQYRVLPIPALWQDVETVVEYRE